MSSTSPLTFSGFEVQQQSWKRVAVKKRDSLLSRELAGKEHKAGAVFFDACDTDEGSDDDYSDDCCSHSHSSSQSSSSSSLPIPKPTSRLAVMYYQARFQLQQAHLQEVHGAAVVQQDKECRHAHAQRRS